MIGESISHIIPGYGLYLGYKESSDPDIPFATKVLNATLASVAHGAYYISTTAYAIKIQNWQIRNRGYYSGPTHGWANTRRLIISSPYVLGVFAAAYAISQIPPDTGSLKETIAHRGGHSPYPYLSN
jgi:hypothetical protein